MFAQSTATSAPDSVSDSGPASVPASASAARPEAPQATGQPGTGPDKDTAEGKGNNAFLVLITAQQAYPAFEEMVLDAQDRLTLSFRIFDPRTALRSPRARRIGSDWADLLADALRRGVSITLYLSDFDPLAATRLHEGTWRSLRIMCGVREMAGAGAAPLHLHPMLHPARIGLLPRLLFAPITAARLAWLRRGPLPRLLGNDDNSAAAPPGQGLAGQPGDGRPLLRALARMPGLPPAFPVTHHQKLAVADGRWLYIGGLDLDERRYDTPSHRRGAQQSWHDVQLLLDDARLARAAQAHLDGFGTDVRGGTKLPPPQPGFLRTLSANRGSGNLWHFGPRPRLTEIFDTHIDEIARARQLIYLETQFLRDQRIARALARRARSCPDLRLILVLPAAPNSVAFRPVPALDGRFGDHLQSRAIRRLRRAFGARLLVVSPAQPRIPDGRDQGSERAQIHGAPIVYLHAKLSIFDDRAAVVSSANLNGRSMRWDTEAGLHLTDPAQIETLRDAAMLHWVPGPRPSAIPPETLFDHWHEAAATDVKRLPQHRQSLIVPYDLSAAEATALPLPAAPQDMV